MNSEPIILVCAADNLFAMPLAVTVRSALENLSRECCLKIYIIASGISPASKAKIYSSVQSDRVEVEWIEISSPEFKVALPQFGEITFSNLQKLSLSSRNAYPPSTYARLLIPHLLPSNLTKALYLDTDMIVEGDLAQLWKVDLREYLIAAVQESHVHYLHQLNYLDCDKFALSSEAKHFNSGMMLLNLEKWRDNQIAEKCIQFILQYPECITGDQDALNVVLAGRWKEVSPCWNQLNGLYLSSSWKETPYSETEFNQALNHPSIIHFTDRPKPWMAKCIHPRRDLFFKYLDLTAWSGWRPTIANQSWNKANRAIRKLQWKANKMKLSQT